MSFKTKSGREFVRGSQTFLELKIDNHKSARIESRPIKGKGLRGIGNYLAKYITKIEEDPPENQGSYWVSTRNWGDIILHYTRLFSWKLVLFSLIVKKAG